MCSWLDTLLVFPASGEGLGLELGLLLPALSMGLTREM